jgi:hypothetical protein
MATLDKGDSSSAFVRAIERWKRGATALLLIGLAVLLIVLICAIAVAGLKAVGATDGWEAAAIVFIAVFVLPWLGGNRQLLRTIGELADTPDD